MAFHAGHLTRTINPIQKRYDMNHDTTEPYELFVRRLVGSYTEHPDLLQVTARERAGTVAIVIKPAPTDFGKVLGKQRKTLTALEVLLCCMANLEGDRISVQLIEPENRVSNGRVPEILNGNWGDEDNRKMAELLTEVIDKTLRIPASIVVKPMAGETMLTIVPKGAEVPSDIIAAIHTLFRAVGATRGRRLVVNAREGHPSSKEGHCRE